MATKVKRKKTALQCPVGEEKTLEALKTLVEWGYMEDAFKGAYYAGGSLCLDGANGERVTLLSMRDENLSEEMKYWLSRVYLINKSPKHELWRTAIKIGSDYIDKENPAVRRYLFTATTVGNPDFGQNPYEKKYGANDLIAVVTPRTINKVLDPWCANYDIGGGNFSDAFLFDLSALQPVARVSYNGGLWPHDKKWFSGQKRLEVDENGRLTDPN